MKSVPNVLIMIESSRESGRKLISGIADYAHYHGPWRFNWEPLGVKRLSEAIKKNVYDGLLVRDVADLAGININIPVVQFSCGDQAKARHVFVTTDNATIARKTATHFLQRGFAHFAFCGHLSKPWSDNRGEQFKDFLNDAGHDVSFFWIDQLDGEVPALSDWLKRLPRPVALLADSDDTAYDLVQTCNETGIRIPEDCAIVGVDNDPVVCGLCNPPLSSVALDQRRAGYLAAAELDAMMKGKKVMHPFIYAPVDDLIVRQSSDMIAIDDPCVQKALLFIQNNTDRVLLVDEVARAAGMNRRALERKFNVHFGKGIKKLSREMRADYLEKLFRDHNLTFELISEQTGFSEPSHLTRFYSAIRGESPSSYRKRHLNH